jgi:hypothetical protein
MAAAAKKALFSDPKLSAIYTAAYKRQMAALGGSTPKAPFGTPSGKNSPFGDITKARKHPVKKNPIHIVSHDRGMPTGDVLDKYQTVLRDEAKTRSVGGKVENPHARGIWGRVADIISRGGYLSSNAALQGTKKRAEGGGVFATLGATVKGAWQGLEGKKKTSYSDLAQYFVDAQHAAKRGVSAKSIKTGEGGKLPWWVKGLALAPDIGLDPTTYLGFGLAGRAGKVGTKLNGSLAAMEKQLKDLGILGGEPHATLMQDALIRGEKTKKAARVEIHDVNQAAELGAGFHHTIVRNKAIADGMTHKTADALAKQAKEDMRLNLTKMSQQIIENSGYRNITIKPIGGIGIPGVGKIGSKTGGLAEKGIEIPLSRYAVAAAAAPFKAANTNIKLVNYGTDLFQKAFINSARVFPELQSLHRRAQSQGLQRAAARETVIRNALGKFSTEQRQAIAQAAFNGGAPTGLEIVVNRAGAKMDASQWVYSRIIQASHAFANPRVNQDLRLVLNAEDINRYFKYSGMTVKGSFDKNPDFILHSIIDQSDKIKDPGHLLFALESSMEQALGRKVTYVGAREAWGAFDAGSVVGKAMIAKDPSLQDTAYPHIAELRNAGWKEMEGPSVPKEFEGHLFHPDTIEGLKRITNTLEDEKAMGRALSSINNLTGKWKFFVTVPNPGFHVRNSIGDWYVNMAEGVSTSSHYKSARIMKIKKYLEQPQGAGRTPFMQHTRGNIFPAAERHPTFSKNPNFVKVRGGFKDFQGKRRNGLNMAEIWAGYNHGGNRQNYTLGEFSSMFTGSDKFNKLSNLKASAMAMSSDREDYWRLAHFIHIVETNPKKLKRLEDIINYASERVQHGHFDYGDFTKFERNYASNVIPFYKWIRKSLPYQTEMLFTKPGKVAVIPKITNTISQMTGADYQSHTYMNTEQVVPRWMRQGGYLPIGKSASGEQRYFNVGSPFGDAVQQYGGLGLGFNSALSSINPALKAGLEMFGNKNTFTGAPVRSTEPDPGLGQWAKDLGYYAGQQTPVTRQIANVIKGKPNKEDALLSWMTGVSVQKNTKIRQMSELIRRDIETANRYKKWRKKYLKDNKLPPETKIPVNLIPSDFKD